MAGGSDPSSGAPAEAQCPVDHKTRDLWLAQAEAARKNGAPPPAMPSFHPPSPPSAPQTSSSPPSSASSSWNPLSWRIPFWSAPTSPQQPPAPTPSPTKRPGLDDAREVSTIPRAAAPSSASAPSNHETETGSDPSTGNWIYPSEKMFFEAMKRKGTVGEARAADMRTVVPIHNAVNERAWKEIREWEAPYTGEGRCDGPKLESFAGLSTNLSPRARINTWLGYTAPFDRHDWVVDRCGTRVEYVIDFYAGRPGKGPQALNFYLDVRPKLNTWEGVKMRALRGLGVV